LPTVIDVAVTPIAVAPPLPPDGAAEPMAGLVPLWSVDPTGPVPDDPPGAVVPPTVDPPEGPALPEPPPGAAPDPEPVPEPETEPAPEPEPEPPPPPLPVEVAAAVAALTTWLLTRNPHAGKSAAASAATTNPWTRRTRRPTTRTPVDTGPPLPDKRPYLVRDPHG
jgi:hypothetical protein